LRADPGAHWPVIIVFFALALLATAGVVWLIVKPGPVNVGRVLTAIFLAGLAAVCIVGARFFWLRLQRRYRLHESGLEYFDGRQTHEISWDDVLEIYEVISSVKLLGLTVDAPQLGVAFVTTEGVRCDIDKSVLGSDQLAPIVSDAVNQSLRKRARRKQPRRQSVPFECVSLSEAGVVIQEPPPRSWWEVLKHRFESNVDTSVVVPGEYVWGDVRDIRVVSAMRGDKLSNHTTYSQLQIRVQVRKSPVFICGIPEFPNFTLFSELLEELKHPLTRAD
jgi:hypothetical protein